MTDYSLDQISKNNTVNRRLHIWEKWGKYTLMNLVYTYTSSPLVTSKTLQNKMCERHKSLILNKQARKFRRFSLSPKDAKYLERKTKQFLYKEYFPKAKKGHRPAKQYSPKSSFVPAFYVYEPRFQKHVLVNSTNQAVHIWSYLVFLLYKGNHNF